jgi:thioesterase domain-containing protein
MQIIRQIWEDTGFELPINAFLEAPTIRQMAARLCTGLALRSQDIVRMGGNGETPILFIQASGGVLHECGDLARAFTIEGGVYGLAASGTDGRSPMLSDPKDEAARMAELILKVQERGPYNIAGYSLGGCVALETAKILRAAGHEVQLMLLDTVFDERYWPISVWLRFIVPKFLNVLRSHLKRRPSPLSDDANSKKKDLAPARRGTRFEFRFRNPRRPEYPYYSVHWQSFHPPRYTQIRARGIRMKGLYRPCRYDGPVSFFVSRGGDPEACSPLEVWPRYFSDVEWVTVPGNHVSMMVGRHAKHLAEEMTRRLKFAP